MPTATSTAATLAERQAEAGRQLTRYSNTLDPYVIREVTPTEDEILEATEQIAATRVAYARLTRELREAERVEAAARDAERQRQLAKLREEKAVILLRLADALRAAAAVNHELAEVEERERNLAPCTIHDVFVWPWLLASTPTMNTHLDHWLTTVRRYGFDV